MMKFNYAFSAALLIALSLLQGCAIGTRLQTESADLKNMAGTYDLYLYGCRYPDDTENVAILVNQNSAYPFEIFTLATRYKVKKGLSAAEALTEANAFVRCSMGSVWQTATREIVDEKGGIYGYDMRPLYMPYEIMASDLMLIDYYLNNGRVTAYITEKTRRDDGGSSRDDRGMGGDR